LLQIFFVVGSETTPNIMGFMEASKDI